MSSIKAVPGYMPQMEIINSTLHAGRKKKIRHFVRWGRVQLTVMLIIFGAAFAYIFATPEPRINYVQADRRIKAIEEYNKLTAAKFKNDCWMNQKLNLPLSPACREALQ